MILTTIKNYAPYIILSLILLLCGVPPVAYGLTILFPFWKGYALISATVVPCIVYYKYTLDAEKDFESFVGTEIERLNQELAASVAEVAEQNEILEQYNALYDSVLWEVPCNCNENVFVGLFSPNSDNICQCEKCKNTYRITLNYESVLLTEPLNNDQIFDSLKTKLQSEPEGADIPIVQVV